MTERDAAHPLLLDTKLRSSMWRQLSDIIEDYVEGGVHNCVAQNPETAALKAAVEQFDFDSALEPADALNRIAHAMSTMQTHVASPRYFGLFNPAPTAMGIAAEALAAAFNPQLAAWSHSPFAVEAERYVVGALGKRFGTAFTSGHFTTGGAEANLTAVICALVQKFPAFPAQGLRSVPGNPTIYVSEAAHHSLVKAARSTGIGTEFLRIVPCDHSLGMDRDALASMIFEDRAQGLNPFMVVSTVGATSTGIIENTRAILDIARGQDLWLHVDAAWGGFAAFVPELSDTLQGASDADSITFDPHKTFSIPMGAGLFLTRHSKVVARAFAVSADYMPAQGDDSEHVDPFTHSMQWSRRFIGLKVLLSLAVAGWHGYAEVLRHQVELGDMLREELEKSGWLVVNDTPFPVVCFVRFGGGVDLSRIAENVRRDGTAWISITRLPNCEPALRACITNYRTEPEDIKALIDALSAALSDVKQ